MSELVHDIPVNELELTGDLSSLASIASYEVDLLINGRRSSLLALRQFLLLIQRVAEHGTIPPLGKVDSSTVGILGRAMNESRYAENIRRVDDLANETKSLCEKIAHLFESEPPNAETLTEFLSRLREFLISLSRQALTLDNYAEGNEPEHPFRR